MNDILKQKLKKSTRIFLIVTLILGILATSFGVGVLALGKNELDDKAAASQSQSGGSSANGGGEFKAPTEDFKDLDNEVELKDTVRVLSENESSKINSLITSVEEVKSYSDVYTDITLKGTEIEELEDISNNKVILLQGDKKTPLKDDRFLCVKDIYSSGEETHMRVTEPYFEDVFDNMGINSSEMLNEENFVDATYAKGVTSHFGNIDKEMIGVSKTADLNGEVKSTTYNANSDAHVVTTATDYQTTPKDLIVEVNFNMADSKDDKESTFETAYGIKGQFGVRDLQAHLVCDMKGLLNFKELYFGLSGETFVDIDVYGEVTADLEADATEKKFKHLDLQGLNEKRFPIAVLEFKGKTPIKITNKQFENSNKKLFPTMFLLLYADWEGHISLEINAGFEYSDSFNNGLRVYKNGNPSLTFENYPYNGSSNIEDDDGLVWEVKLGLEADTDLTLFGSSVVVYLAGVNFGEISISRLGIEAKCDVSISVNSKDKKIKVLDSEDTEFYIRGYLKLIETKFKLKADGKNFLDKIDIDLDFQLGLLDLTLFEYGLQPNKFKPAVPVSTIEPPTEFDSVISMVCDVSGSMSSRISTGESKLQAAKDSAKVIVNTTKDWAEKYKGNYGIGVVKFASSASTVTVPHVDYKYINQCIDIMNDGGGTSIHSGIDVGVSQLEAVKSENKIMILMTDGQDSNDSATLDSAKKAASAGIKIFVIGFGDDVNEEILKQIAQETSGEYRFASTESIVGIMGSFMYAQQAGVADVKTEIESSVAEGETSEKTKFAVDDKSGNLIVSTAWPGSFLDTILIDPNGRIVDENYPNAVTDESKIPSTITVENPIKGEWSVAVKGVETSFDKEPFYTIVSFMENENAKINNEMSSLESMAAYCLAIGIFTTLVSAMFLLCFINKNKVTSEENKDK